MDLSELIAATFKSVVLEKTIISKNRLMPSIRLNPNMAITITGKNNMMKVHIYNRAYLLSVYFKLAWPLFLFFKELSYHNLAGMVVKIPVKLKIRITRESGMPRSS